jgi:uncharacterized protein (TIGR04222 family)
MSHQPWGLSGPEFMGIYTTLAVAALAAVPALWAPLRRPPRTYRRSERPSDVYTLALLKGGEKRVVDTAVQALVAEDRVRVSRDHRISAVDGATAGEPVQREVLAAITALGSAELEDIRYRALGGRAVHRVHEAAVGQGLLLSEGRRARAMLALLLPTAVLVLGVVRLIGGASAGRPVGLLVLALVVTFMVLMFLLAGAPRLTTYGQSLRARAGSSTTSPDTSLFGTYGGGYAVLAPTAVLGVAAFGAQGLEDPELRAALYGGASTSSGGGAGCGSGDGGGGGHSGGGHGGGGHSCGGHGCGG